MGYDTVNKFLENQNVVHKREYFTGGISVRIYYSYRGFDVLKEGKFE